MGWAKDDFLRTASEEWWQSPHLDCDSPRHHLAVGESAFERTARLWDWESLETLEVAQHAELEGTSVRWCNVPPAASQPQPPGEDLGHPQTQTAKRPANGGLPSDHPLPHPNW